MASPVPARRVDHERVVAVVEVPRLDQAGNPEDVVAVEVRDEQIGDGESGPEAHHLALGSLPGVEEQAVAFPVDENRTRVSLRRRHCPTGSEEGNAHRHLLAIRGRTIKQPSKPLPKPSSSFEIPVVGQNVADEIAERPASPRFGGVRGILRNFDLTRRIGVLTRERSNRFIRHLVVTSDAEWERYDTNPENSECCTRVPSRRLRRRCCDIASDVGRWWGSKYSTGNAGYEPERCHSDEYIAGKRNDRQSTK